MRFKHFSLFEYDHVICSNYNTTMEDPSQQYHDTEALGGVWTAVWQLVLAMLVKGILTIFTFGIKVKGGRSGMLCARVCVYMQSG